MNLITNPPFFSVVIPLYNKEKHIISTLETVVTQTFTDFEIIIINDGSTDNSVSMVKNINDERIKIINQENQGLSGARNSGIKHARAQFIAFIDADDFWLPHHLEQFSNLIKQYPDTGMYSTGYSLQKAINKFHRAKFNNLPVNFKGIVPNFFKHSLQNCVAWVGAICIPRKVFDDVGSFDPEIFSEQDTDLYIRIALKYDVVLDDSSISAIYNRTMDENLSNFSQKKSIPKLFNTYKKVESKNPYLKKFMDYNRFSTIIYLKLSSNNKLANKLIKDVDFKNITALQKLLIKLPNNILRLFFNLKTKWHLNALYIFKPNN